MKLNEGLIEAHYQFKQASGRYEKRNEERYKKLEKKLKEDKAKSNEYFNNTYSKQDARVARMRKLLKVDWSDKYGK